MSEQENPQRRPGRREKAPGKPKAGTLTFRVRADMREKLEASARVRDLSMSEEVERRILLSLDLASNPSNEFIIRTVADALRLSEMVTGKSWPTDRTTATMACAAMQAAASIITAHHDGAEPDEGFTALAEKAGVVQAVRAAALYSGMPIEKLLTIGADDVSAFFGAQAMREVVPPELLARLLREGAPAGPAPTPQPEQPAARLVDQEEAARRMAGTKPARGQLPPSIGDRAAFDETMGPPRLDDGDAAPTE